MFLLHHRILKMRIINAVTSDASIPANSIVAFIQWKRESQPEKKFFEFFCLFVTYVDRGPKPSRLKIGIVSS